MAEAGSVIVRLLADIRQFKAQMAEGQASLKEFATSADTMGGRLNNVVQKASTGLILGIGGALVYGVKRAFDFQEALDKIQNQSGATAGEVEKLRGAIVNTSNATGKSVTDVANSALIIEQAGIRGAKAISLLDSSTKAAVVTGTDLASVTKTIVAVQALQVAKGMEVHKLTGILVAGSKDFVGGLDAEEGMLKGRVGAALANYGYNLKTIIGIGSEFSKVGLPTRSIVSFVNSMGSLEKATTDSKGKLTTYAQSLKQLGLNQTELATMSRRGDIVGILKAINEQAIRGGQPLKTYLEAVFGNAGAPSASALIKNLTSIAQVQKDISGAGSQSFATMFANVSKQLGPQLDILKNNLSNTLMQAGEAILPTVSKIVGWVGTFAKAVNDNPVLKDTLGAGLAAAFAVALAVKLKSAFKAVQDLIGFGKKTAQTIATDTNTVALQENTDALLGKGGGGVAKDAENVVKKGGWLAGLTDIATGLFSKTGPLAIGALGVYDIYKTVTDPTGFLNPSKTKSWIPFLNFGDGSSPKKAPKKAPKGEEYVALANSKGIQTNNNVAITQAQLNAVNKWMDSAATQKLTVAQQWADADNIMKNFAKQDQKGNYSVTIRVI